jgi:hypothetical protein
MALLIQQSPARQLTAQTGTDTSPTARTRRTAVPLMGPADSGSAVPVMGPADCGSAVPLMGPADSRSAVPVMGPASPDSAVPVMGPADRNVTSLMSPRR